MKQEYIVIAFTENQIGVLNRITSLYLRRKNQHRKPEGFRKFD